jgi:hypothetical protein
MKATTCVRVILKFRQVHVDRSHRIDAVFPNLIAVAFITAQMERKEVVYPVVLAKLEPKNR